MTRRGFWAGSVLLCLTALRAYAAPPARSMTAYLVSNGALQRTPAVRLDLRGEIGGDFLGSPCWTRTRQHRLQLGITYFHAGEWRQRTLALPGSGARHYGQPNDAIVDGPSGTAYLIKTGNARVLDLGPIDGWWLAITPEPRQGRLIALVRMGNALIARLLTVDPVHREVTAAQDVEVPDGRSFQISWIDSHTVLVLSETVHDGWYSVIDVRTGTVVRTLKNRVVRLDHGKVRSVDAE